MEGKINIETVKMLLVLRQTAQYRELTYRGRKRIEAVCETTVTVVQSHSGVAHRDN